MKIYLIILSLCLPLTVAAQPSTITNPTGYVKIAVYTGQLKLDGSPVVTNVFYPSVLSEEQIKIYKTQVIGSKFTFNIPVTHPVNLSIKVDDNNSLFSTPGYYLASGFLVEPGDSISLRLDNGYGLFDMVATGRGSEKINFIRDRVVAVKKIVAKPPIQQTFEERAIYADTAMKVALNVLESYRNRLSTNAYEIFKAELFVTYYDLLLLRLTTEDPKDEMVIKSYNKIPLEEIRRNLMIPHVAKSVGSNKYQYVLENIAILQKAIKEGKKYSAEYFRNKPSEKYRLLDSAYNNTPVKDHLLAHFIIGNAKSGGLSADLIVLSNKFLLQTVQATPYHQQVKTIINKMSVNNAAGARLFNFNLTDDTGKTRQLSDYKGKLVLIDFWFNGCAGCKIIAPKLEELEKQYKDKAIEFLSISVDNSESRWKQGIGIFSARNSVQLYTNGLGQKHPFIEQLSLKSFPHLILVDQSGKLLSSSLPDLRTTEERQQVIALINQYLPSK